MFRMQPPKPAPIPEPVHKRSLPEHLCRTVHAPEWATNSYDRKRIVRDSPCGDCLQAISAVDVWLDLRFNTPEMRAAIARAWRRVAPESPEVARSRNALARVMKEVRK